MVTGFGEMLQSALVDPPLTTVTIPSVETSRIAATLLLNRICNPNLPFVWTRVKTTPVWRGSTK
ncbi:MAG: substrate-binding domain-containing protein [Clostridia bacterium]|jgi:LacI family transcriptional regulator|nr:substrate-binding domain-containing protein [Clostridia bacterium]MBR3108300.1 substrate-binding domain-containing protein [Clostridia bacterium]